MNGEQKLKKVQLIQNTQRPCLCKKTLPPANCYRCLLGLQFVLGFGPSYWSTTLRTVQSVQYLIVHFWSEIKKKILNLLKLCTQTYCTSVLLQYQYQSVHWEDGNQICLQVNTDKNLVRTSFQQINSTVITSSTKQWSLFYNIFELQRFLSIQALMPMLDQY